MYMEYILTNIETWDSCLLHCSCRALERVPTRYAELDDFAFKVTQEASSDNNNANKGITFDMQCLRTTPCLKCGSHCPLSATILCLRAVAEIYQETNLPR